MPFLLLLLLTLVCLVDPWPEPLLRLGPPDQPGIALACGCMLTWLTVFAQMASAAMVARWTACRLHLFPEDREQTIKQHAKLRHYLVLGLVAGYALILWVWGWGWAVQSVCVIGDPQSSVALPGVELLTLAPLLAGLFLSWTCLYDADKALHDTAPVVSRDAFFLSRRAYLVFQLRQNLALLLVPLLMLVAEKGLGRLWPGIHEYRLYQGAAITLLAGIFIGLPWILRLVLSLKPLPHGPIRDRLEAASRRLGFRCGDILLWDTRGVAANAMVVGLLPYPRYVILTDKLLEELTPDEVEAVFGHEVGHIRHRHMAYYLVFLLLSLAALTGLWQCVAVLTRDLTLAGLPGRLDLGVHAPGFDLVPFVVLLGLYIFVVFGFLSRRCERQADIYGCRTVSCGRRECQGHYTEEAALPRGDGLCPTGIRTFVSALEKVALVNGISRDRPGWLQSWQHSTIARRVEFLQQMLLDPPLEPRFQRRVLLVKAGLLCGLFGVATAVWSLFSGPSGLAASVWALFTGG